jgi:folate-binding protein YgfZ
MPESALCAVARARGAACVEVDGWSTPANFAEPELEYAALRDDAALVDLAFRDRLRVSGADRVEFLQGMLSNDVKALTAGRGCAALVLTEQGKVVAECLVLALDDAILLDGLASGIAGAAAALARYVVADDVEIQTPTPPDHAFGLFGPHAPAALERLGVAAPPREPYSHVVAELAGTVMRLVRVPAPDAGGFLCLVPAADVLAWWQRCGAAGIRSVGQRALEALRIESGMPCYGRDFGPDTIALEAPLEHAISFAKGCYLGQEVIERVSARGHVNRRLVGLEVEGATVPAAGDPVFAPEREVGRVTSASWSWRLGHPVALGYVRREHVAAGTRLEVRGAAGSAPAIVRPLKGE